MTQEEIIQEAHKRGYDGATVKGLDKYDGIVTFTEKQGWDNFYYHNQQLWITLTRIMNGKRAKIYDNGKWAEIVSSPIPKETSFLIFN